MLSNHLLDNWEFDSLEEKRSHEWQKGVARVKELKMLGKYNGSKKKAFSQFEGKYEDFKLPPDKNTEYKKMIVDNIKFSEPSKELEQKIYLLKTK